MEIRGNFFQVYYKGTHGGCCFLNSLKLQLWVKARAVPFDCLSAMRSLPYMVQVLEESIQDVMHTAVNGRLPTAYHENLFKVSASVGYDIPTEHQHLGDDQMVPVWP